MGAAAGDRRGRTHGTSEVRKNTHNSLETNGTPPHSPQVYLMMRTLRDMNMSKFVAEDVPLFMSLIDDLFPGEGRGRLVSCSVEYDATAC